MNELPHIIIEDDKNGVITNIYLQNDEQVRIWRGKDGFVKNKVTKIIKNPRQDDFISTGYLSERSSRNRKK